MAAGTCRDRGFSLLELVIVLAILAVLAAIAVARYANATTHYRADAAARRIVADLDLARAKARSSSSRQAVVFSVDLDQYQIRGVPGLNHPSSDYTVRLAESPYHASLVGADFAGTDEVVFDGWGMPDNPGSITLRVGNVTKAVIVDADTGEAHVQ